MLFAFRLGVHCRHKYRKLCGGGENVSYVEEKEMGSQQKLGEIYPQRGKGTKVLVKNTWRIISGK